MRILITGAAGFIGSHLADRLIEDSHDVGVMDTFLTGRRENYPEAGLAWRFVIGDGDVANREHVEFACSSFRPEVILHCAASYDDRDKWHRDADTNVKGAINVGIEARKHLAHVVYFQTALIYQPEIPDAWPLPVEWPIEPRNSYAISKYAAEQYLRLADVPLTVLRLANVYGPRNLSGPIPTFYKRLSEGDRCTVTQARRDFVYVDDLVDLVAAIIAREATGTYHVSTGRDYPIRDVYDSVCEAMNKDEEPISALLSPDDVGRILLDPHETHRDFGWRAETTLDEGIRRAVAWYEKHGVEQTYTHLAGAR